MMRSYAEEVCVACLVERGDGEGGEGESSSAWGEKARVRAAVDAELAAVTRAETREPSFSRV